MNVERYVRLIAGLVVVFTVAAGYWLSPWFFVLTAFMGANLIQSAFTDWCPMMPVLRSLGVEDARRQEPGFRSQRNTFSPSR